MSALGIYFGPKVISVVESKGKKILNEIRIPRAEISAGELEEKVPEEIKLVTFLKDELSKKKIEAKEATISLSGKDLIIRTFEVPAMLPSEMAAAVNFEAKKYIPFKVEDLVSDFQLQFDRANRKNQVLFVGIKKETLDKYLSILKQLAMKANPIEYAAFTILRCLQLTGIAQKGIISVISVDFQEEDEVSFVVLKNGFPLFSRDITLTSAPQPAVKAEETAEPGMILEKFKAEIRVSLDYYHRKFPTENIKQLFFISDQNYRSDLETFAKEMGLSAKFIDVERYIGKAVPFSLSFIKGYSCSLSKVVKIPLKIDLLTPKAPVKPALVSEKFIPLEEAVSLFEGLRLDFRVILLGFLICLATLGVGIYRIQPLRKELNDTIGLRPKVATVGPEASYEQLTSTDSEYKRKLDNLNNLIKKQLYLTSPLNVIPQAMPAGVWLVNFSFREGELTLEGMVYLADTAKEFNTVSAFLANLKQNPEFTKYFKYINITSLDRGEFERLAVTKFVIISKAYGGEK